MSTASWYLELSKPVLWDDNASDAQKKGTRRTLVRVLETILRIAHPLMPYITEEIWQRIKGLAGVSCENGEGETIMLAQYPEADDSLIDEQAIADLEWAQSVIVGVRNIRGEMNISPAKAIPLYFQNGSADDKRRLEENRQFLTKLASLETITWLEADDEAPLSATGLVGEMEILVPMAGLIDKDAELARLNKEVDKLQKDVGRIEGKLNNPKFVDKAPADVVQKERDKLADMQSALGKLEEQIEKIAGL